MVFVVVVVSEVVSGRGRAHGEGGGYDWSGYYGAPRRGRGWAFMQDGRGWGGNRGGRGNCGRGWGHAYDSPYYSMYSGSPGYVQYFDEWYDETCDDETYDNTEYADEWY